MPQALQLPESLQALHTLAYNLKWSWTPSTQELFAQINPTLWKESRSNPVEVLKNTEESRLTELAADESFVAKVNAEHKALEAYLSDTAPSLAGEVGQGLAKGIESLSGPIAYFSMEYGITESLPIYAGGLGVLAGDHTKSASDLNIPFVGIGMMYRSGYFEQSLDENGLQQSLYPERDFSNLPVLPVLDGEGQPLILDIPLPHRKLFFRIWEAKVGRSTLYLLDTQLNTNREEDRELTAKLYGGDTTTRICQELLIGVGGVRALQAMGVNASVYHLNEGHAAFVGIERVRQAIEQDGSLSLEQAIEQVKGSQVFTTHTPVPAGHDRFMTDMVRPYFQALLPENQHGNIQDLLELGLEYKDHMNSLFCMTVLALHTCRACNGVSKIHGDVSRKMWQHLWPQSEADDVPIGHITNGIHAATWTSTTYSKLFDQYIGEGWESHLVDDAAWNKVNEIPAGALWDARQACKAALIDFARYRVRLQRSIRNESAEALEAANSILDPNAFTIGFARRFAPYKRATLIFSDSERLSAILNNSERPVQILFAGKAHPHNREGQALIQTIHDFAKKPEFAGKIVLLENYDMAVGRHLVQGVDLWLNNPTPPQEASGTSGQKVAFNGGVNLSILDGWWDEGYNGENGWAIGDGKLFDQVQQQNDHDVNSMYSLLENDIVPMYYNRDADGVPQEWIAKVRKAMQTLISPFNTHRMVRDYLTDIYAAN
ncbi:MAG: alpha-glucan family phosphorylase [Deltaproteobacteria bacterium]|nr:MAG: alpha-glucan family phosphorylase [Deltaproteobacteria bacterium]